MLAQLRSWLVANVAEVAALDGLKVHVTGAEQGTTGTHVVLTRIDEDPNNHLAGAGGLNFASVDIDCKAATPDDADTLAEAIKRDLEPHTGAMGTLTCEAVLIDDTRDWQEKAKPGRPVDMHVTTVEITLQYRR